MLTVTIVWGSGLVLLLAHRSMLCLGHLGACLLRPRQRRLRRRLLLEREIAQNQRLSRDRPQIRHRPLILAPPPGRNGRRSHSRSLRGER
jgi:hypothetical protein